MAGTKGILILTPFFSPNIGGAETHFDDLVRALGRRGYHVYVLTYCPITTANVAWKAKERPAEHIFIRRYRWFGKDLFHAVEKYPLVDFLYITPYLFFRSLLWMLFNAHRVQAIHAQGFNAAWIGLWLGRIFRKKLVVSTHAIYEINPNGSTARRIASLLAKADRTLCLSRPSYDEMVSFGMDEKKLGQFRYWIDLDRFRPMDKQECRQQLSLPDRFTVLFVGRLIEKKGARVLARVAEQLPMVHFVFVGSGPDEQFLRERSQALSNLRFEGAKPNTELHRYYNASDLFCIPSQYEEGFGRVVMEAVACGLPVVGANRGGIPEALDETVSILVDPTEENLKHSIELLYTDKDRYRQLATHCRCYAEQHFSERNVELITRHY